MSAHTAEQNPVKQRVGRLLAEERRRAILATLKRDGRVTVADLAAQFCVSAVTARADLVVLSESGLLVRSHGGAVLAQTAVDTPIDVKVSLHHDEKVRIGRAAAALVGEGQTILLDSGTTTLEVARALNQRAVPGITVITHALNIATEFSHAPHTTLIMIGGILRQISQSFVGPQAEAMLARLHWDHFFLGVNGLDAEGGVYTPDVLESGLNAAMIRTARQTTVVADSSKIGRRSLATIAPLSSIHRLITDTGIRPEDRAAIERLGVKVITV